MAKKRAAARKKIKGKQSYNAYGQLPHLTNMGKMCKMAVLPAQARRSLLVLP